MKAIFCKLNELLVLRFFERKSQPLVRLYDFWIGSECKYCMATRAALVGAGVAMFNWAGLFLVLAVALISYADRRFSCDINKPEVK